jgi:2-dehydro-3-deoxyphosphogluconate aldolase/(4S)-4-hydroxy-2-oxoglutarate aldolase
MRLAPTAQLLDTGVVAILRARTPEHVDAVVDALFESGIRCVELTFTVPDAVATIARLAERLPEGAALGAGTVTDLAEARQAIDAGASFLVSPAVCPEVVEYGVARGLPCYPGAWTPTEVLSAWRHGASAVKLFPAASGGPAHLRRMRDPFPHIPFVPTGGVDIEHVRDYFAAGAVAVGLGGPLLGDALTTGDTTALRARAKRLLDEIAAARSGT